jgi:hypothetical protein
MWAYYTHFSVCSSENPVSSVVFSLCFVKVCLLYSLYLLLGFSCAAGHFSTSSSTTLSLSLSLSHAGNPFSHPAFCVSAAAALTSYFYCYDYDNYYLGHPFPHPAVRASATAVPYSDHFLRFFVLMFLLLLLSQDIHFHILHYVSPLQRHYIRILWQLSLKRPLSGGLTYRQNSYKQKYQKYVLRSTVTLTEYSQTSCI